MRRIVRAPVLLALALLASCASQSGGNEAAAAADEAAVGEHANAGKPPVEAATPGAERFVGRWSADGNCAHFMELGRDGSYVDYNGSRGTWRPEGEHLLVFLGEQGIPVESHSLTRC